MSHRSHLKCRLHQLEGLEVTVLIKNFFPLLFIQHPWGMLSADAHKNKATERGKQQEEENNTETDNVHCDALHSNLISFI